MRCRPDREITVSGVLKTTRGGPLEDSVDLPAGWCLVFFSSEALMAIIRGQGII